MFSSQSQSLALSLIDRLQNVTDTGRHFRPFLVNNILNGFTDDLGRIVSGTVVHYNDFQLVLRIILIHSVQNRLPYPRFFIKAWHNDGNAGRITLVCRYRLIEKTESIFGQQKCTGNNTVQIKVFIKLEINDAFGTHQYHAKTDGEQQEAGHHQFRTGMVAVGILQQVMLKLHTKDEFRIRRKFPAPDIRQFLLHDLLIRPRRMGRSLYFHFKTFRHCSRLNFK